eukprot:2737296-Rhodomonas_salina.3
MNCAPSVRLVLEQFELALPGRCFRARVRCALRAGGGREGRGDRSRMQASVRKEERKEGRKGGLSLIHISEPTRPRLI